MFSACVLPLYSMDLGFLYLEWVSWSPSQSLGSVAQYLSRYLALVMKSFGKASWNLCALTQQSLFLTLVSQQSMLPVLIRASALVCVLSLFPPWGREQRAVMDQACALV